MENKDAGESHIGGRSFVYGDTKDPPYINGALAPQAARARIFGLSVLDPVKNVPDMSTFEPGALPN